MLQLSQSRVQLSRQFDVAAGASIVEEGRALILVNDSGVAKVQQSAGGASEVFAGFSVSHTMVPTDLPSHSNIVANGTSLTLPFTPISGQLRIVDTATNTALTIVAGAPAAGEAQWVSGTTVTLNAAQSGITAFVSLRYTATVAQALAYYGEGFPGKTASQSIQNRVSAITKGRVATTCYDVSAAYTAGAAVKTAANGYVSGGGSGTTLTNVICAQVPSAGSPYLVLDLL